MIRLPGVYIHIKTNIACSRPSSSQLGRIRFDTPENTSVHQTNPNNESIEAKAPSPKLASTSVPGSRESAWEVSVGYSTPTVEVWPQLSTTTIPAVWCTSGPPVSRGSQGVVVFTNITPSVCCTSGLAGGVVLVEEIDVKVPFI
ncbi:hypothetical protein BJX68DRAFT_237478 [Aspergillus pseudodeflectus]|uniref:Uncharacterized protein n=1 Tax=Aspergillus pseudodeflectus TaxID=176178 RepID=A0ABR4KBM5_9EURO